MPTWFIRTEGKPLPVRPRRGVVRGWQECGTGRGCGVSSGTSSWFFRAIIACATLEWWPWMVTFCIMTVGTGGQTGIPSVVK